MKYFRTQSTLRSAECAEEFLVEDFFAVTIFRAAENTVRTLRLTLEHQQLYLGS